MCQEGVQILFHYITPCTQLGSAHPHCLSGSQHVLKGSMSPVATQGRMGWVRPDATASDTVLPETSPKSILTKAIQAPLVGEEDPCWGLQG